MRTDKKAGFTKDFRNAQGTLPPGREIREGASLSGNERDSLYLSMGGKQFVAISGISGLDHPGDGRSFAILDYDRDGRPDLVVVSADTPLLQLFRNRIGKTGGDVKPKMLAVRFVGGNHTSGPTASWTNRNGYGAVVTVKFDDLTVTREHRAGEGLAAQNSATMLIGIGERSKADALVVRWPSGKVQETANISAGTLVTVYENPAQSPTGAAFVVQPYKPRSAVVAKRK